MGRGEPGTRTSWIIRDAFEQTRFREMHGRLVAINTRVMAGLLAAMVPLGVLQPKTLSSVAGLAGIAFFGIIQRRAERFRRPEVWVLIGLLGGITAIVGSLAAFDAARSPAMALVAWPISGLTGRYNNRVVAVALGWTIAVMELAIIAPDPSVLSQHPIDVMLAPLAMIAVATSSAVLRDLDIASRGAAILDPLTGLFNRHALDIRVGEVEHQSVVTGKPVAVIAIDVDHFKRINDTCGHAVGDHVLRDVAYVIRAGLGVHDIAYRVGGEEFAVLMPAQGLQEAADLAERLRAAIAAEPLAGVAVRASIGVAASSLGERFCWDAIFPRADAALYAAKRGGRDRVVLDGEATSRLADAA